MAHEDAGHYAGKHPEGTRMDPEIADAVRSAARDGKVGCAAAHAIARELDVEPEQVGVTIDLLEYRIERCQLGLFGYGLKKGIVEPADPVDPDLKQAVEEAAPGNRITCAACWEIAKRFNRPKMAVAAVCEALSVKIKKCQLGSF